MASLETVSGTTERRETRQVHRTALCALLLNLLLAALKGAMALVAGSLALTAGAIDSGTDAVAFLVLVGGLRLSTVKTRQFPLGLYKIENMLSVIVTLFIFLTGDEIAREAFTSSASTPQVSVWIIGLQAAALVLVFIAWTGWELLSDGMRVLLDAAIDCDTLGRIEKIVESDPTVTEIKSLVGRNAGRFRFLNLRIVISNNG